MSEVDRKNYFDQFRERRAGFRQGFLDVTLSGKGIKEQLSGLGKYDGESLAPLPFEGLSVIHNIGRDEAENLGLATMAKQVVSGLDDAGLTGTIAFVSTESFHATTLDLINDGEHEAILTSKYTLVRSQVEAEALAFVNTYPKFEATVDVIGLGIYCPHVLKLNLAISGEALERFQEFRLDLHRHLCRSVPDYSMIRAQDWNKKLSGHITFGYFVKALDEARVDALLDYLESFNENFKPLPFRLSQGEVTQFTDMDHYQVI